MLYKGQVNQHNVKKKNQKWKQFSEILVSCSLAKEFWFKSSRVKPTNFLILLLNDRV